MVLDQAEVDVATVISDAYGTAQVLRRQQFAQAENGQWQLQPKGDLKHPIAEPEPWVGIVLTTTVKAEDAALGMVLHDSLDADLAAFCAAAQAAGRLMAWNTCTFQLLSDGLPVKLDRRGIQTGWPCTCRRHRAASCRRTMRAAPCSAAPTFGKMIARWQGRDRSLVIETLLAVWLAPNAAALAADGVPRDWDQLERDLQFDALATEHGAEARRTARQRLVAQLQRLAVDVMDAGGRNAVLGLFLNLPSASPAIWLTTGLHNLALDRAVLARWDHAPPPMPADRALLYPLRYQGQGPRVLGRPRLAAVARQRGPRRR